MGGVAELWFFMLVIAAAAFAPLGYFIYRFTKDSSKPLGETEPHGDSPSLVNDLAEKAIKFIGGLVGKK